MNSAPHDGRNTRAREKEAYGGERRSLVVVESSHWSFGSLQFAILTVK
jgi:hypothetical protein